MFAGAAGTLSPQPRGAFRALLQLRNAQQACATVRVRCAVTASWNAAVGIYTETCCALAALAYVGPEASALVFLLRQACEGIACIRLHKSTRVTQVPGRWTLAQSALPNVDSRGPTARIVGTALL